MPKEVVYGVDPYGGKWKKDLDGPEIDVHVPVVSAVEVRWNKESGYFQMATCMHNSSVGGVVTEFPTELRLIFGEPSTSGEEAAQETEFLAQAAGCWVTLDRKGINDVIRNLRRARDQAFGRDE